MTPSPLLDWRDHTCVICASGPSLSPDQVGLIDDSDAKVIVTNTTFKLLPTADVLYACDFLWWKVYHAEAAKTMDRRKFWTQDTAAAERYQINWVRGTAREGLGQGTINVGGNAGTGAINLAVLFGARRILLVGFDMKPGPQGEKHWHADHPAPLVQVQLFEEWMHKMKPLARDLTKAGIEVINCTPESALTLFPMGDLAKELDRV
jgi:hypothetical protein